MSAPAQIDPNDLAPLGSPAPPPKPAAAAPQIDPGDLAPLSGAVPANNAPPPKPAPTPAPQPSNMPTGEWSAHEPTLLDRMTSTARATENDPLWQGNPIPRIAAAGVRDTAQVVGNILNMINRPTPAQMASETLIPGVGPAIATWQAINNPKLVKPNAAVQSVHSHVTDAANWLTNGGQPEGFWENVGATGAQFLQALMPGGLEAKAGELGLAEEQTIMKKVVAPLAEKLGISPQSAETLINNKKLTGLMAIGIKASKDALYNAGITYAHTGDLTQAAEAGVTGFAMGLPLHGVGHVIGSAGENITNRLETSASGETVVKPPKLSEAQIAENARKDAVDAARMKAAQDYLDARSAVADTKKTAVKAAQQGKAQGVRAAEESHAADLAHIEEVDAHNKAVLQAQHDAALAKAQEDAATALQQQQQAGQQGIRETAQQMLARHLAEINESRAVTPGEAAPPDLTFGVPHADTMEAGPTTVTGQPTDVRVTRVPGQGTQAVPAEGYTGPPEAAHATTYPPATVTRPGPPEPVGGQGTMTMGAPIVSEGKIGSMGAADAIVGRERLKNLNDYIHSDEYDNLPQDQQRRIRIAHDDLVEKMDQYDRNRAATGNGVRPMFEPIDIPGAVKNLGSHTEAADFLHDTVTRGFDELADRGALAGKSRNTYNSLKKGYKTAEAGVRGAVGTENLTASETALEEEHQKMTKFLQGVGASPAEVDQLNNSYKNYLVMRDVGRAVDGAFESNPYLAKLSGEPNTFSGEKLGKALTDLVNKRGIDRVTRVMGKDNLASLLEIAKQTRTAQGSQALAEATENIGKDFAAKMQQNTASAKAAIAVTEAARQQAIDQETARLAAATETAEQNYKNSVGPLRTQYNQERLAARSAERTHAAQVAAQKAADAEAEKAGAENPYIRRALPHLGAAQIFGGAGYWAGHMTGIPGMGAVGYGAGQLAYAGGYVGVRAANRAVWSAMESNSKIANFVLHAVQNGVKASTYVPIVSEMMVNQALGRNDTPEIPKDVTNAR